MPPEPHTRLTEVIEIMRFRLAPGRDEAEFVAAGYSRSSPISSPAW
jgi:hypothetical protein